MLMPSPSMPAVLPAGGVASAGVHPCDALNVSQKDTTFTKIFVGGLPYHTTDKSLREHFEQFGEIDEAVVITDRQTGKSRGYGFVTMADRLGADRAIKDPNPVIDGRKANVNLAYLGAKPRGAPGGIYPGAMTTASAATHPRYFPASYMSNTAAAAATAAAYGFDPYHMLANRMVPNYYYHPMLTSGATPVPMVAATSAHTHLNHAAAAAAAAPTATAYDYSSLLAASYPGYTTAAAQAAAMDPYVASAGGQVSSGSAVYQQAMPGYSYATIPQAATGGVPLTAAPYPASQAQLQEARIQQ